MATHLRTGNFHHNRVLQKLPTPFSLIILISFQNTIGQYPPPGQGAGGFGQPYPPQQQPQYGGQPYGAGQYPPQQNPPQYSQGPLPYPPGGAGYPAQAPGYPQAPQPHVGGSKHGGAIAAATGSVANCTVILKLTIQTVCSFFQDWREPFWVPRLQVRTVHSTVGLLVRSRIDLRISGINI